jgi:hypothetical protein
MTVLDIIKNSLTLVDNEVEIDGFIGILAKDKDPVIFDNEDAFLVGKRVKVNYIGLFDLMKQCDDIWPYAGGPLNFYEKCSLKGILKSVNNALLIDCVSKLTLCVVDENEKIVIIQFVCSG